MAKGPVAPLNIVPGGDNINDFARKYQQEIANIYSELDMAITGGERTVFSSNSVYWNVDEENNTATFTIAVGNRRPVAVYRTFVSGETEHTEQVMVGLATNGNEMIITCEEPFNGYVVLL